MKIIVPYVENHLHRETKARFEGHAEFIDVTGDEAYFHLLCALWRGQEPFLLIEEDIIQDWGVIEGLERCPEPWCVCPYRLTRPFLNMFHDCALGCTRFRPELIHFDLYEKLSANAPWRDWRWLDSGVNYVLREEGYQPHIHWPAVHLHEYSGTEIDFISQIYAKE